MLTIREKKRELKAKLFELERLSQTKSPTSTVQRDLERINKRMREEVEQGNEIVSELENQQETITKAIAEHDDFTGDMAQGK